jgi:hypothetical protein
VAIFHSRQLESVPKRTLGLASLARAHRFVSLSGDNAIAVIDYATATQRKVIPVGKFPQRSRLGKVPASVIALLKH